MPTYKRSLRICGCTGMAGGGEGEGGSSAGYVMRFDSASLLLLLESRLAGWAGPFSKVILMRIPSAFASVVDDQCGGLCNRKGEKALRALHRFDQQN